MEHVLVSGVVRGLSITKGYEDLAFTGQGNTLVGLATVVAASTGNLSSSAILSNSSRGAEVDMEFFTCTVEQLSLKGRFHKVDFKDREHIEFVVSIRGGLGEVHAARDHSQRFIWTVPYHTRGHIAQKRHDISSSFTVSIAFAFVAAMFAIYQEKTPFLECGPAVLEFSSIAFCIVLLVNFLSRHPFLRFSFEATKIFRAFGYDCPERVDLPKHDRRADKAYCIETGQPRPLGEPWKYRY